MPYNISDKTIPFSVAYGINNLHSGNGKLVRHLSYLAGNDIKVKAQFALIMGVAHGVRKITYDGADIPASNYQFYKGTPGQIAALSPDGSAASYFPNDVNHWKDASKPGASFVNIDYPEGMKIDGQPEKTIIQLDCRETYKYNASGSILTFDYSANPARAVADIAQIVTGRADIIDFGALHEYEAWCDELITITKDNQHMQVPRFRLDVFFTPPFTLKEALNRICQLTCSDWQERGGKIRMIPGTDRSADFNLNTANLAWDFDFEPVNAKAKFNGVIATWRDLDDPLKDEGEPIIVDRRANEFIPKKFYQLNLGGCYRDQGERVSNCTAKIQCDLTDFGAIRASYAAYPVLPCDLGTITHPIPLWNNVPFKVLKKKEKEDRTTTTGVEKNATGYPLYICRQPENPYSDTNFNPIQTRQQIAGLNPFAAPPLPNLSFLQQPFVGRNGAVENHLIINVQFGSFVGKQRGKLLWMKPGESYQFLADLIPDSSNSSSYVVPNAPSGNNYFRVVAYNVDYFTQSTGMNDSLITIGTINTALLVPIIAKTGTATRANVQVGITNLNLTARFRKIEISTTPNFAPGTIAAPIIRDSAVDLRVLPAIENIGRNNNLDNDEIRYARISESTTGTAYSNPSNILELNYFNELEDGVPVLFDDPPTVSIFGGVLSFEWNYPLKNGYAPRSAIVRLLDVSQGRIAQNIYSNTDTEFVLNDASGLPTDGQFYIADTGETIGYTNISGNVVQGVTRGVDGSTPLTIPNGASFVPVSIQRKLGDRLEWDVQQTSDSYIFQYRWVNRNGYSLWSQGRLAGGSSAPPEDQPTEPTPPPAIEPPPPAEYEDPLDPSFNKLGRYKQMPEDVYY